MRAYFSSCCVALVGLVLAFTWAGPSGLLTTLLLMILEIGFSFDNAVVNATVLRHMNRTWQHRFLTWGIAVSAFGMYYLFPLLIVSLATGLNIPDAAHLALYNPTAYRTRLQEAHVQISAFGGMFLLMVFLRFVCDEAKTLHWIGPLERRLSQLGRLESIEAGLALLLLLALQPLLPETMRTGALMAGTGGVTLHIIIRGATALLVSRKSQPSTAARIGIAGFFYLLMLDASFSLDAVIGAFALSDDLVLILLGLTAGAMFVRALTIQLVRRGTLQRYIFLEHGAYYAIGALALIMLAQTRLNVPETLTGLVGAALIGLSFLSSRRELSRKK